MAGYMRSAAPGRVLLQLVAAACAAWWCLYWILWTFKTSEAFMTSIYEKVQSRFLGTSGDTFLLQIVPIIIIALVGFIALELKRRIKPTLKLRFENQKPRINIWTMPIIVRSPFGMLTVGDIIIISVVVGVALWYFLKWTIVFCQEIDASSTETTEDYDPDPKWIQKIFSVGYMWGWAAVPPMTLLWIPVSRGSPILNVIGVPFERAVKYHIWLGSFTIWCVIFHGVILAWYYIEVHMANKEGLFQWYTMGIAILPGDIAFVAGILILITALDFVRRRSFDIFYSVHHLYLVFLLFYGFHYPWGIDYMIVPVVLFFLDRFMRMVQSRKHVDVLAAKVLGSGVIELTVAKPPGADIDTIPDFRKFRASCVTCIFPNIWADATYHALSFLYMRLPSVSRFMWHPFSVASSPLDQKNQIAIFIKPLGKFTRDLHDILLTSKQTMESKRPVFKCPFSFKVGLEGPYGSESMFYLRYKSLVMVAGGIGVTPFLAIIKDVLHRYRLQQEGLPSSLQLILCVKNFNELHILDTLAPNSILPDYEEHIKITVNAYVTQESDVQKESSTYEIKSLPSGKVNLTPAKEMSVLDHGAIHDRVEDVVLFSSLPKEKGAVQGMSTIGSTGYTSWVAATVIVTLIGYFVIFGLFSLKYHDTEMRGPIRIMLYLVSITLAVVVCGGGVMLLWALHERRASRSATQVGSQLSNTMVENPLNGTKELQVTLDLEHTAAAGPDDSFWKGNVTFGRRPNWKEMFHTLAAQHSGEDVGVMVSGGLNMQQDVASYCKLHSLPRASTVVFHYHSVSFDL